MEINERRNAPRFDVSLSGTATTENGFITAIRVTNVSSSGLQFSVNETAVMKLIPKTSETHGVKPVPVSLEIDLQDHQAPILIECGIVYIQRKSMAVFSIGCRYEEFASDATKRLQTYLARLQKQNVSQLSFDNARH